MLTYFQVQRDKPTPIKRKKDAPPEIKLEDILANQNREALKELLQKCVKCEVIYLVAKQRFDEVLIRWQNNVQNCLP